MVGMRFESIDLPEPGGPIMRIISPFRLVGVRRPEAALFGWK